MSAQERCPWCGASIETGEGSAYLQFECGSIIGRPIPLPDNLAPSWVTTRSRACELLEESVEVIHQLQAQVETSQAPRVALNYKRAQALRIRNDRYSIDFQPHRGSIT